MTEELKSVINQMATYLAEGEKWHKKAANELRAMPNKRGYARIHDDQAALDGNKAIHLDKMFRDHLKYSPVIDSSYISKAEIYTIPDFDAFKQHFFTWMNREKLFKEIANKAIDLIRYEDMELYGEFCTMAKDLRTEYLRAEWLYLALADTGFDKSHCAIVSKWLHDQAESNPGDFNWNIG